VGIDLLSIHIMHQKTWQHPELHRKMPFKSMLVHLIVYLLDYLQPEGMLASIKTRFHNYKLPYLHKLPKHKLQVTQVSHGQIGYHKYHEFLLFIPSKVLI
jgi:hypothetical protein